MMAVAVIAQEGKSIIDDINGESFLLNEVGENGTILKYKTTVTKSYPLQWKPKGTSTFSEINITNEKKGCLKEEESLILKDEEIKKFPAQVRGIIENNRIKLNTRITCFEKDKIFYRLNKGIFEEGEVLIYQNKKSWKIEIAEVFPGANSTRSKGDKYATCEVVAPLVKEEEEKILHTRCQHTYENGDSQYINWYLAKGRGIQKIVIVSNATKKKTTIRSEMVIQRVKKED